MKREALEKIIERLDAILATLYQDNILSGSSTKQKRYEAVELLQRGRLKLVEELEEQETAQAKDRFLWQALEDLDGFDGVLLPQEFYDFIVQRDGSCCYSVDELETWLNDATDEQMKQVQS